MIGSLSFVEIFESFDFLVSWFSSLIDFVYLIEFGLSFESIVVFREFIIFEAVASVVRLPSFVIQGLSF